MFYASQLSHLSDIHGNSQDFFFLYRNDVTSENRILYLRIHVSFPQVEVNEGQVRVATGHSTEP